MWRTIKGYYLKVASICGNIYIAGVLGNAMLSSGKERLFNLLYASPDFDIINDACM